MKSAAQTVPKSLIYEMVDGKPIYYKGYKDYLNGNKQLAEIMGSSIIQSLLIGEIVFLLKSFLGRNYLVFTNELGVQFSKKSWRSADIAIVESHKIKKLTDKYIDIPPKIIIEIDTKAALNDLNNSANYFHTKTDELLDFGVEKVIWIFTGTKKVLVAEQHKKWETSNWTEEINVLNELNINIQQIINKLPI